MSQLLILEVLVLILIAIIVATQYKLNILSRSVSTIEIKVIINTINVLGVTNSKNTRGGNKYGNAKWL